MQQVFYIHGGEAYSQYEKYLEHLRTTEIKLGSERPKRWADSLQEELGEEFSVISPTMPNKHNAKYVEWKIWFERHFEFLADGAILLGWSQGGMFLVKYLLENDLPFTPKALLLVAAPYRSENFDGEDGGDFPFDHTQLPRLAKKINKLAIFHSKDDFVVPYEHALEYKKALPEAELVTFEGKNHFLIEEFPELASHLKNI